MFRGCDCFREGIYMYVCIISNIVYIRGIYIYMYIFCFFEGQYTPVT